MPAFELIRSISESGSGRASLYEPNFLAMAFKPEPRPVPPLTQSTFPGTPTHNFLPYWQLERTNTHRTHPPNSFCSTSSIKKSNQVQVIFFIAVANWNSLLPDFHLIFFYFGGNFGRFLLRKESPNEGRWKPWSFQIWMKYFGGIKRKWKPKSRKRFIRGETITVRKQFDEKVADDDIVGNFLFFSGN